MLVVVIGKWQPGSLIDTFNISICGIPAVKVCSFISWLKLCYCFWGISVVCRVLWYFEPGVLYKYIHIYVWVHVEIVWEKMRKLFNIICSDLHQQAGNGADKVVQIARSWKNNAQIYATRHITVSTWETVALKNCCKQWRKWKWR